MIHSSAETNSQPQLTCEPTSFLPLVKPGPFTIDLSDLLSSKTPLTPSTLSTYDCTSVKADDDFMKTSAEVKTSKRRKPRINKDAVDFALLDQKVTLGEIVAKRPYTRRPKEQKNEQENEKTKRKRAHPGLEKALGENVVKKEKLESGERLKVKEEQPKVPELVFIDGKLQLVTSDPSRKEENVHKELEVVEPGKTKVTTSTSFKKVNHTEKWTEKETDKFYRALALFGADFSMISRVFKTRNRNQVKNKFLREEKLALEKVNQALKEARSGNIQNLYKKLEKLNNKENHKTNQPVNQEPVEEPVQKLNLLSGFPSVKIECANESSATPLERNERSGSFHSTSSIDSIDKSILEDLADILMPHNKALGII